MNQLFIIGVIILVVIACGFLFFNKGKGLKTDENIYHTSQNKTKDNHNEKQLQKITVKIEDKEYSATLEDNETTKSLLAMFPMEMDMKELNGNEKYFYLDNPLPTNVVEPRHIQAGDIMLYGEDCIVIFYQAFETTYRYTKIGHIDNLPDLGNKNVYVELYY